MEISPTASGIQAFLSANQRLQDSAEKIAKSSISGSSNDLTSPLIELKVAEQEAGAAVKIIEAEATQVGTLLDLNA